MAKLRVNWAPDKLLTLAEVLKRPGYYFNAVSGDIFRHEDHTEAMARLAPEAPDRIWLFLTDDLDLTEGDVRGLLRDGFNVRMADQGRLISRAR